jgi:hypothetical protein
VNLKECEVYECYVLLEGDVCPKVRNANYYRIHCSAQLIECVTRGGEERKRVDGRTPYAAVIESSTGQGALVTVVEVIFLPMRPKISMVRTSLNFRPNQYHNKQSVKGKRGCEQLPGRWSLGEKALFLQAVYQFVPVLIGQKLYCYQAKAPTCYVRGVHSHIREVERQIKMRERLRLVRLICELSASHLEICVGVEYLCLEARHLERKVVTTGVNLHVRAGCEGEVGGIARELRGYLLGKVARGVDQRRVLIEGEGRHPGDRKRKDDTGAAMEMARTL